MRRLLRFAAASLLVAATVLITGCAVNRATATVDATARLDMVKTMHVKPTDPKDYSTGQLIADDLRKRGYQVSIGPVAPVGVDAVVTYVDKWMWDITMYMLELTVQVRDPKTDYTLATGHSLHTSLTRKSPPEMVDEVVGNIMKEGKGK
jgi:hypothetical protein